MVKLSYEINITKYSYQDKMLWHDVYWMSCKEATDYVNEIVSKHDDAIIVSPTTIKYYTDGGYIRLAVDTVLTR